MNKTNQTEIYKNFRDNGIITFSDIFESTDIENIKNILRHEYKNIYNVRALDLSNSGILNIVINKKIKYLINLLIPDGILWHCLYLRTPSNQSKPHFDPQTRYGSWHRDRVTDYTHNRIDFVDIMIYLNDVDENDGAFAFLPKQPNINIDDASHSSKIIGSKGTSIFSRIDWYHTATPNMGNKDREMIRLSFAKNMYHAIIQESEDYKNLRNSYKEKDDFLFFIFGGNRSWYKNVEQPSQNFNEIINFEIPPLNWEFKKSYKNIVKSKLKKIFTKN